VIQSVPFCRIEIVEDGRFRQEAKTKQKRTKKRDQLDYESVEMQLAD
jgi:hypothetical protein